MLAGGLTACGPSIPPPQPTFVDGRPSLVVFTMDGRVERRIDLSAVGAMPHQFAILPDGRIIVEAKDGRLVALHGDSVSTFVDVRAGATPGLIAGTHGGVVQALPDKHITLYNQFGHMRWRINWPWRETAVVTDVDVDANGRIHLIAGIPSEKHFVVYSISPATGEVVRWSIPGPSASFLVDHYGAIVPDTTGRQ